MKIEAEITEEDIIRFYKEYGFGRNWIGKVLIMLLIDLIICAYLQIFILPTIVYGLLLFLFFFVIPYYITRAKLKRSFENDPTALGKKIYKPFASGIEITDEKGDIFLRYETISKIGNTRHYVFIFLSGGNYCLLPKWSFSSFSEIDRFAQLVTNGVSTVKGVKVKEPLTFKPIYLVGVICLIPLIGAIAGIIFIILGIAHYRDRVFIVMGAVGILITVAIYGSLFYFTMNSATVGNGFARLSQIQLNDLVKSIEFYKLQHGSYPDSLQQLDTKDSFVNIDDPTQTFKSNKRVTYQYHKLTNDKYVLFSVGVDGIPGTKDDIYPEVSKGDSSRLGYVRKK